MPFFKPFALERFFARHEFSARYLLCSSDCESMPVRELLAMAGGKETGDPLSRLLDLRLGYTETRGAPGLRAAISEHHDGLSPDAVIVHSGAEEAILNLCLAILSPGDRVVVNHPCYQSLAEIPRALGCEVIPWAFRETPARAVSGPGDAGRWALDPDELPALSAGKAKLIMLNLPHNPTGALPAKAELEAIIAYARQTGAVLFIDEVYRRLELDQSKRLPSACEAYENGVSLDVLSKHSGLAGLRIGWLASRRTDILDAVAVVKDYNSICSSAPSEFLAEIAVRNMEMIAAKNRALVAGNIALLDKFFARHAGFARWTPPQAGSIAFPQLCDGSDSEILAERLVAESGVLLLPGKYYGYNPSYFRIGFGRANMPEALGKLEQWLDGANDAR
jgi:aspartate/methionine/tyrosine aminotransferase